MICVTGIPRDSLLTYNYETLVAVTGYVLAVRQRGYIESAMYKEVNLREGNRVSRSLASSYVPGPTRLLCGCRLGNGLVLPL